MSNCSTSYFTGTSGINLPVPNKTHYPVNYQDKSRLCYYASLSNSIEINSSFYQIPRAKTLERWVKDVPADFRFSFKLYKGITHSKALRFDQQVVHEFMNQINGVGDKKGMLLIQLPPSIQVKHLPQIEELLATISASQLHQTWPLALECRHESLYGEGLDALLHHYQATLVVHDKAGVESPIDWDTGLNKYLRFHGPNGNYRGTYDDAFLAEYASYIREWLEDGQDVYVYFNNTMGKAHQNMLRLRTFVQQG